MENFELYKIVNVNGRTAIVRGPPSPISYVDMSSEYEKWAAWLKVCFRCEIQNIRIEENWNGAWYVSKKEGGKHDSGRALENPHVPGHFGIVLVTQQQWEGLTLF